MNEWTSELLEPPDPEKYTYEIERYGPVLWTYVVYRNHVTDRLDKAVRFASFPVTRGWALTYDSAERRAQKEIDLLYKSNFR
jgi:hypothetical protein